MPKWFGVKYPSIDDMEEFIRQRGCLLGVGDVPSALFVPAGVVEPDAPPVILIPESSGPLERAWLLAHEIGHLVLHDGPRGTYLHDKDESAANKWAVQALIPERAVVRHRNASTDSFIAALSAHYEDIPPVDCPQRRLAAYIAQLRLKALEEVA